KILRRAARITRRALVIVLAIVIVATGGAIGGGNIVRAVNTPNNTNVSTMQVGDMTRSYTVLTPAKTTLSASAPIIMVLSGLNASQSQEINRDEFTSYAT